VTDIQLIALFLSIVVLYFIEHLVYAVGVFRGVRPAHGGAPFEDEPFTEAAPEELPVCTVLVCARDEEENIERCLASLIQIDYPIDRLEVLIVDDKSTDRTPEILRDWQSRMPNLRVLRTGEEIAHLKGKVNALTQGLDAASGEFVMITDADSRVPKNWVRRYLQYYEPTTGMVASLTLLDVHRFPNGVESMDWAYTLGIAMASANINVPLSVIGNNISIRKVAYDDVGGYRKIPFSVTEDFALFQAIWHQKPWTVRFPAHEDLTVMSEATPNFRAWWRQKQRWVKGGQGLKGIGYLIVGLGLFGNLAMMLALFLLPLPAALATIFVKLCADLLVVLPVLARTRMNTLLRYFLAYEIYLTFYVLVIPIMLSQKKVKWKGRVYQQ
jgi:cellulose synthase/poly-beta-1,6-N-acetylglucosamine synthase-like glycosyltransferase